MAVHPGGDGVICSLPQSCRLYEWDTNKKDGSIKLCLKPSEKVLDGLLEGVGQQLAITFSHDGSLLAVGGEDGTLRAFKWPSMASVLDAPKAHTSVKNLDFSPNGKFLVSVGSGPGRVWDISSSTAKASLPKENDEIFGFCRFSQNSGNDQVLYVTAMRDRGGYIVKWNTTTWKRISSKYVVRDPMSAFSVSNDGKFLAIGTIQGDVHILNSSNMKVHTVVKKAHLGLVTALAFSSDSRALASASLDSSARVTLIKEATKSVTFDIVEAILLLCDVKDLLRNQSVCKEWCKLISSSCFVKTHHEFVCNKEDNTRKISMITLYMSGERVPEEWRSYDRWSMEGSCNGLVLLRKKDDILCANPVTRVYRRFSSPKRESKEKQCFGFGYDSSSDDYKVVMASSNMSQFHIFSLKSNIWKLWGSKEKGIPVEKKKEKIQVLV